MHGRKYAEQRRASARRDEALLYDMMYSGVICYEITTVPVLPPPLFPIFLYTEYQLTLYMS